MSRTFTYRKISSLGWSTDPDGSTAGIIKVEIFKDLQHTQRIGKPEYYFGSVAKPCLDDDPGRAAYTDARRIAEFGTKIDKKLALEIAQGCGILETERAILPLELPPKK